MPGEDRSVLGLKAIYESPRIYFRAEKCPLNNLAMAGCGEMVFVNTLPRLVGLDCFILFRIQPGM